MRILLAQISTNLIYQKESGIHVDFYNKLWEARKPNGFIKPDDFWEIPNWIAQIHHNIPSQIEIVRDVDEFIGKIQKEKFTHICFSVMECNKAIIEKIIQSYQGTIVLGGYVELDYFHKYPNVLTFKSIPEFVAHMNLPFEEAYDYKPFLNFPCIPRLSLSTGCKNTCVFCTEVNKFIEMDVDTVRKQAKAFKDLQFSLVYLNDKTFGQAKNHVILPELYESIKSYNPEFQGFIIQTTTTQFLSLPIQLLKDSRILYVELGVESCNDHILKKYRKPSSVEKILQASMRATELGIWLVPNIIIGFEEETQETYQNTLHYLNEFQEWISHLSINNLAVYDTAEIGKRYPDKQPGDLNQYIINKSFHKDESVHHWFHNEIFKFGLKVLDKNL